MVARPCNPSSDLRRLWQTLLPGTPFPQCGTPAETGATGRDEAPLAEKQSAGIEPSPAQRDA